MKIDAKFFNALPHFDTYYNHILQLFKEGKTTGDNQSNAMINYTKLSLARTKRGLKNIQCNDALVHAAKNTSKKNWLVITEAWCGDAGNIVPLFVKLAEQTPGVTLKMMIRDEYPKMMENYLTNGAKSIPIFVAYDDDFTPNPYWGPRPKPAQDMVIENKQNPQLPYEEFAIVLQKWYQQDKTETLQKEITEYLK
jgi:hypothetical protein